jgi:hypothetical protein
MTERRKGGRGWLYSVPTPRNEYAPIYVGKLTATGLTGENKHKVELAYRARDIAQTNNHHPIAYGIGLLACLIDPTLQPVEELTSKQKNVIAEGVGRLAECYDLARQAQNRAEEAEVVRSLYDIYAEYHPPLTKSHADQVFFNVADGYVASINYDARHARVIYSQVLERNFNNE